MKRKPMKPVRMWALVGSDYCQLGRGISIFGTLEKARAWQVGGERIVRVIVKEIKR